MATHYFNNREMKEELHEILKQVQIRQYDNLNNKGDPPYHPEENRVHSREIAINEIFNLIYTKLTGREVPKNVS